MTRKKLVLLIIVSALVITVLHVIWGRPALKSDDTKLGGSAPPLKAGQTALIGLRVTNSSGWPVVLKSVSIASDDGTELINAYADERMMIGIGLGPNDYIKDLPSLANYRLPPGKAINVLLEFQAPMISGEYAVGDIRVHYIQHAFPKTLRLKKFERFTIVVE